MRFVHHNGAQGDKRLPESMGSGCAFLDYDNDGRQDLLLINGRDWPGTPPTQRHPVTMALYRNLGGKFEDVTSETGLSIALYGMGVACGDFDNDGWVDLFISALGRNVLLRNLDGHFVDVTSQAGVGGGDDAWSTSCGWLDYDNDGDLDLFVANYLEWSLELERALHCRLPGGQPAYCPPTAFRGTMPYLYRNGGDGTFQEVSQEAGLQIRTDTGEPLAKALGVVPVDLDADGWVDLVVANDTRRNLVFHNRGQGRFAEVGVYAGIAYDSAGQPRGAMGIDAADFRNNGSIAVGIGNFADEMTALYVTETHPLQFTDQALTAGVGSATRDRLTFGLLWLDYDLDSRLDLLLANGHLEPDIQRVHTGQQYAQPAQLFWNTGRTRPRELMPVGPAQSGPDLFRPLVGRGASYADIDQDGDLDLVLTSCGGPPRLLRNDQATGHSWLRFRLVGRRCNRDAIGTWLEVKLAGRTVRRQVMPTRSYLSQVELPITLGLGADQVQAVEIRWADGSRQSVPAVRHGELTVVVQP
ncbi:MAG: CRTAC1 family protein [Pirellulaceae bacterium]|nr:CRTAC1 family protein [Pirellulaceae bacterium]